MGPIVGTVTILEKSADAEYSVFPFLFLAATMLWSSAADAVGWVHCTAARETREKINYFEPFLNL